MNSFSTEIAVYFMSNKEMSYLIMNLSLSFYYSLKVLSKNET